MKPGDGSDQSGPVLCRPLWYFLLKMKESDEMDRQGEGVKRGIKRTDDGTLRQTGLKGWVD